jgi:signal transduction histidine kinase
VQEAMTNCARHAEASTIDVVVKALDGQLHVSVTDDGIGLDPERRREGLGLRGMEERVRELGGTVTIARRPKRGTTLAIRVPVPQAQLEEATLASATG